MKRKLVMMVVIALVLTVFQGILLPNSASVTAAPEYQGFDFVKGTVTASMLNVRQGPSTKYNIVCVLKRGQEVKVFGKIGSWYAVYEIPTGNVGAVNGKYINIGGAVPAAANTNNTATTPAPSQQGTAKPKAIAPTDVSKDEQAVLDLVNNARKDAGLTPLQFDAELLKTARLKAKDMADNGYFSHQSPTYGSPFDMMRKFNVSFKSAGENIAGNRDVEGAFTAWMKSEGHKKNILNGKFNYTGIGIVEDKAYGKVFVQMFIGR